jgi:hypothetical protein
MDRETYRKYAAFGRDLTENDEAALSKMMENRDYMEHWDVIRLMLEKGLKLEQECVDGAAVLDL